MRPRDSADDIDPRPLQRSAVLSRAPQANVSSLVLGALVLVGMEFCRAWSETAPPDFPVRIAIDLRQPGAKVEPVWRFFGADEPNYATMRNGRRLIRELGALRPGEVYFRAHNLLTSGDGTPALKWGSTGAYREDASGAPIYDWSILDGIFGTYLRRGVRPYVQIGFMPRDLSVRPEPYQHRWTPTARYDEIYTGWAWPPKDFGRWEELVFQWASHCVQQYGRKEVERWYWEVWNEPNIGYWRGTREEFFRLHDHAIAAVRRALPTARVGGPDVAGHGGEFSRQFLEHCLHGTNYATGTVGTPLDFVSFHAKGRPQFVDGHVRMGMAEELKTVSEGFALVSSFPELRHKPVIIGECDPDGCAACQGPQLGYRNTTMYSSYTAASFVRIQQLAARHGVRLEGLLTWAFLFEDQPLFAGFRQLASGEFDLPVLNVFRMFSRMNGNQVPAVSDHARGPDAIIAEGVRGGPDIDAFVTQDDSKVSVLLWHYHDDDVPGPAARVTLEISGPSAWGRRSQAKQWMIDAEHSNAYTAWLRMGSPARPNRTESGTLRKAGQLTSVEAPRIRREDSDTLRLELNLPRQGVSLVEIARELNKAR